jgi:hypothetical protein
MNIHFKKSNRKYKWTTSFFFYSCWRGYGVLTAIENLKKLYPTAIIQYRSKNKMLKRYKIVITFTDIADEAHFLLLTAGHGLEI